MIPSGDEANNERLFEHEKVIIDLDSELKSKVAEELCKKILLQKDCFEGVRVSEAPAKLAEIISYIHNSAKILKTTKELNSGADFKDLINKFSSLLRKKTDQDDSLTNIETADSEVKELVKELINIKEKLIVSENEATQHLSKMVKSQKEAEELKELAEKDQKEVEERKTIAEELQASAQMELNQADTFIGEAQQAISSLTVSQINTLKSLATPPPKILMVAEALMLLLARKKLSWKGIRARMGKREFIQNLLTFDSSSITPKLRRKLEKDYLSKPEWNVEALRKTSKTIVPLAMWIRSQVRFSGIEEKIRPLRARAEQAAAELLKIEQNLAVQREKLEESEQAVKREQKAYENKVAEIEPLKSKISELRKQIEARVKTGGDEASQKKQKEVQEKPSETATGDSLLVSAALTYLDSLDNRTKNLLVDNWRRYLERSGLKHTQGASVIDLLGDVKEEIDFASEDLNGDSLQLGLK